MTLGAVTSMAYKCINAYWLITGNTLQRERTSICPCSLKYCFNAIFFISNINSLKQLWLGKVKNHNLDSFKQLN